MDNLKKYLQNHRDELDIDEPGEHLWQAIQERTATPAKKKGIVIPILRWAAAACILILAGTGVFHLLNNKTTIAPSTIASNDVLPIKKDTNTAVALTKTEQPEAFTIDSTQQKPVATIVKKEKKKENTKEQPQQQINEQPENVELASFSDVINMQKTIINHTPLYAETPAYFSDFKTQLAQMDKDEIDIRHDLKKNGINPTAIDQLINIYQQKITLLKKLQKEINKTNQRYKQSRSTDTTSPTGNVHYMNI